MHDVRILKPGFSVVSPEYVVGPASRRGISGWCRRSAAAKALPAAGGVAASS